MMKEITKSVTLFRKRYGPLGEMRFFSCRSFFRASLMALSFVAMSIFAQDSTAHWFDPLSGEYVIEETYVGEADVRRDHRVVRDFDESNSIVRFISNT